MSTKEQPRQRTYLARHPSDVQHGPVGL